MTKVYIARAPKVPEQTTPGGSAYLVSPDAMVARAPQVMEESPLAGRSRLGGSPYLTNRGSAFDLEINILDSGSQRPLRAVEIVSGLVKGYTDRRGRLTLRLPAGHNAVSIDGMGYVENGNFTPKRVDFDPVGLEVELDSDEIVTVFTTGEVVMGERHNFDNPGHQNIAIPDYIKENLPALALGGGVAVAAYYIGKSRKK